jgi:hypothetical protein
MDKETFEKHKPFAGETKPSMLRRRIGHDYQSRRIYLITMTIAGRRPLLGKLVGNCNAPEGADDAPHIELTELGLRVRSCWMAIESHYPAIKVLATQIMPDHLHGILFVQEHMEVHMSQAIKGFKTGCNKVYRELFPSASPAISKGEKAVMRAALNAKLPLVFITSYGFTQFSHPGHQYYDACAEGRLLLLAPWPHQNRKEKLTRTQCLQLNTFAQQICQHTP